MSLIGLTDPGTTWPRGTLSLREPRLAQAGGFAPRVKPSKAGPVRPFKALVRPSFIRPVKLVPLASLLRMKRVFSPGR